jgi:hypothetical protein
MNRWDGVRNWLTLHSSEIWLAAFFAIVFALVLDVSSPESRVRAGVRHIKNKLSERSVLRLQKRIQQLQVQKDRYVSFLSSDKALYLATFQIVIGVLVAIATAAGLTALGEMLSLPFGILAIFFYAIAIIIAFQGFKVSSLDTRAKVTETVVKLESEIAALQTKLAEMIN